MNANNLPTPWPCTVSFYGNEYAGAVVGWGKTRVRVSFTLKNGERRERTVPVATLARPKGETSLRTFVTPCLPQHFNGAHATPLRPEALAERVLACRLSDLVNASGHYRPTILPRHAADIAVADAYDRIMVERGDPRRAFRGSWRSR